MFIKIDGIIYEAKVPITVGNKSIINKPSGSKEDLADLYKNLFPSRDSPAHKKGKRQQEKLKAQTNASLQELFRKFSAGDISPNQFKYNSKKILKEAYLQAFRNGITATGLNADFIKLPTSDKRWLDKFKKTEYGYLNKFIDDMVSGKGRIPYDVRLNMYVKTLDGLFEAGRVDAFPLKGTKIYWIINSKVENCADCINLAANSPYTVETLPTTPRSGDTACLTNCACFLRISYKAAIEQVELIKAEYDGPIVDWNDIDSNLIKYLTEHRKFPIDVGFLKLYTLHAVGNKIFEERRKLYV